MKRPDRRRGARERGGPASAAADLLATSISERLLGTPGVEACFTAWLDSLVRRAEESRRGLAEHLARPLEAFAGTSCI